jgi:hypothetical protein
MSGSGSNGVGGSSGSNGGLTSTAALVLAALGSMFGIIAEGCYILFELTKMNLELYER